LGGCDLIFRDLDDETAAPGTQTRRSASRSGTLMRMRLAAPALAIVSLPMWIFGWRGTATEAGHRRFDEMDSMYPLGALFVAAAITLLAIVVALIRRAP
jgi:hypothetical protein